MKAGGHTKGFKFAVVIDNKQLVYTGSDVTTTQIEANTVVNGLNDFYIPIKFEVILAGLEIWNEKIHLSVETNIDPLLTRFCIWKTGDLNYQIKHDAIRLWVNQGYGIYL